MPGEVLGRGFRKDKEKGALEIGPPSPGGRRCVASLCLEPTRPGVNGESEKLPASTWVHD